MKLQFMFAGTPTLVAAVAFDLSRQLYATIQHDPFRVMVPYRGPWDDDDHREWEEVVDASDPSLEMGLVRVDIIAPSTRTYMNGDPLESALLLARVQADRNSLIDICAADHEWADAKGWWGIYRAGLERVGTLAGIVSSDSVQENQTSSGENEPRPDLSTAKDEFIPPTREEGRKYYKDYNRATARQIGDAFPTAWATSESSENLNAKWGPSLIAKTAGVTPETASRYLRVFREAGITHIHGIELPPRINRASVKKLYG